MWVCASWPKNAPMKDLHMSCSLDFSAIFILSQVQRRHIGVEQLDRFSMKKRNRERGGVQWPQASNLGWPLFQTCRPTWFILRSDDRSWYKCFASCDLSVPSTPASVVISCTDTWMAGIRSVDILTTLTFTELRLSLSMIYYGLSQ